jgi:lactate dehydrogenase-like 2-hydroxyacid dehydrogenase
MGTGTSSFVDVSYAKKMGIRIANTPHLNSRAVVEFTLAMVVNCLAGVFQSIHGVKTGTQWIQTPRLSLSDCRVGILGMGAIGTELASRFFRAGTRSLSYYSRTRKLSLESRWGLRYLSLPELAKEVDVLCLHATYTQETHYLLNKTVLALASDHLKIVNLSHPQIICPQALGSFLRERPNTMCFLDGYYREWNDNRGRSDDSFGLLELPNFVATSHIAAQEHGAVSAIYDRAATILNELLAEGQSGTHSCISSS